MTITALQKIINLKKEQAELWTSLKAYDGQNSTYNAFVVKYTEDVYNFIRDNNGQIESRETIQFFFIPTISSDEKICEDVIDQILRKLFDDKRIMYGHYVYFITTDEYKNITAEIKDISKIIRELYDELPKDESKLKLYRS